MDPKQLYATIDRIIEIEIILKNQKVLKFKDPVVQEYRELTKSIKGLSLDEIKLYHLYIKEKFRKEQSDAKFYTDRLTSEENARMRNLQQEYRG